MNPGPHARTLVLGPPQECLRHRHIVLRFRNLGFYQARSQQQFYIFFAIQKFCIWSSHITTIIFSFFIYFKATITSSAFLILLLTFRRRHLSCLPWTLRICRCPLTTRPILLTHPRLRPDPPPYLILLLTYLGSLSLVGGVGVRAIFPGIACRGNARQVSNLATHGDVISCIVL